MTLDPFELIDKASQFVKDIGSHADAVSRRLVEAEGAPAPRKLAESPGAVKKAPATKVDPKQSEADAQKAEAAAERAREQGELNARTARTEADLRAKKAVSEAHKEADDIREQGDAVAKPIEAAAEVMRQTGNAPGAASLEAAAKGARAAAEQRAKQVEKAGEDAYQEAIKDGEFAAKAAEKAAHETEMEYRGAAEDARDDAADARASARMQADAAARKRAEADRTEAQRDRPEVSDQKEVDLDADDAADVRATATAARATAEQQYEGDAVRITKARDEAAREQWSQEQDAKAAKMQVQREQKVVDDRRSSTERLRREADAAEAKGDQPLANSLRENAQRAASDQRIAEARRDSSQAEADRGFEASKAAKAQVDDLEKQYKDLQTQRDRSEKAVDGIEERARLLEQAKAKLEKAETTGDEKLRREADALVEQAEKVHVDQEAWDEASAPPFDPDAPVPTAAELGALTEKYSNAAQSLHQRRLDELRSVSPNTERVDQVERELSGVTAQLNDAQRDRERFTKSATEARESATKLQRDADRLLREGKSKEGEERQEEAALEVALADRAETRAKQATQAEAELQGKATGLQKELATNPEMEEDYTGLYKLEQTGDKLDDVARAIGDAHRARVEADELTAKAAVESKPEVKAQLEQQARDATARSSRLFQKAQQKVPTDDLARKALDDAGVDQETTAPATPTEPPVPAAPAGANEGHATRDDVGDDETAAGQVSEADGADPTSSTDPSSTDPSSPASTASAATGSDDTVGDEGAGEVGGSDTVPDQQPDGGTPPAQDQTAFATEGESFDETDPSAQTTVHPEPEIQAEQESTYEEQSVAMAQTPAQDEFVETGEDDSGLA